jgi:hypothetical protein
MAFSWRHAMAFMDPIKEVHQIYFFGPLTKKQQHIIMFNGHDNQKF